MATNINLNTMKTIDVEKVDAGAWFEDEPNGLCRKLISLLIAHKDQPSTQLEKVNAISLDQT